MDRLVAGDGAALSKSVMVTIPTSFPPSTTGRRRILCSSMTLRASGADVLGSTTMAPRVKTSLTFMTGMPPSLLRKEYESRRIFPATGAWGQRSHHLLQSPDALLHRRMGGKQRAQKPPLPLGGIGNVQGCARAGSGLHRLRYGRDLAQG